MTTPHVNRIARFGLALLGVMACQVLTGCASAPADRFYILGNRTPRVSPDKLPGVGVTIATLTIPELVDRPQLVLRTGSNRVTVLDNQRWAESLKTGIARVLASDLAAEVGTAEVGTPADRSRRKGDLSVSIDILRFDSALNGMAQIDARWIVRTAPDAAGVSGSASVQEPSGATVDEVVAAHDRALARIAAQLARTVRQAAAAH